MQDYATMPAGPALNAEIAVKVMGWPRIGWEDRVIPLAQRGAGGYVLPNDSAQRFVVGVMTEPWRPSEDNGHAWDVVEAMRAKGWLVVIKANSPEGAFIIEGCRSEYDAPCKDKKVGIGKVVCEMQYMGEKYRPTEWSICDTMPLAVCRTALEAAR